MTDTCIHIGLPKAASSYLQLQLLKAGTVSVVRHPELKQLRLAAFGEYDPDQACDLLRSRFSKHWNNGPHCVVTDERLSSWRHFDFRFFSQAQVRAYQLHCARLLRRSFGKASVLLLARNPRAWLASLHAQYIKAGETLSLSEFCNRNQDYLRQAIYLDDLVEIYSTEFGRENIAVFPIEAMGLDDHGDWRHWFT